MVYVALLRGINVGGKRIVDMKLLKSTFERAGMERVSTYINSGNVIFQHRSRDRVQLADALEQVIEADFGFRVEVLLRNSEEIGAMIEALPATWTNDQAAKCDAMFLWEELDRPEFLDELTVKPGIDEVKYLPGAVLWRVDRQNVTRSGMMKLLGTPAYRQMTVRNCNTLRRLAELVRAAEAEQGQRDEGAR
jgi:uncharacterized protein (DUF1697 family)